jgi:hypothetical protein
MSIHESKAAFSRCFSTHPHRRTTAPPHHHTASHLHHATPHTTTHRTTAPPHHHSPHHHTTTHRTTAPPLTAPPGYPSAVIPCGDPTGPHKGELTGRQWMLILMRTHTRAHTHTVHARTVLNPTNATMEMLQGLYTEMSGMYALPLYALSLYALSLYALPLYALSLHALPLYALPLHALCRSSRTTTCTLGSTRYITSATRTSPLWRRG